MKKIKDYLYENGVYIWKEARKLITDGLLGTIYKPTPLKWPADDSVNNFTDNPANNPADDPANNPTDDPTPALLLLLTAPVQTTQPIATATAPAIIPPRTQIFTPTIP